MVATDNRVASIGNVSSDLLVMTIGLDSRSTAHCQRALIGNLWSAEMTL
jgi:hypothetical protein